MRSSAVLLPPEVRALTVLDTIPAGCRAMPVPDDRNAPHLRRGEMAVIDPGDCALVHGELFVIQYGRGPAIMQVAWKLWLGGWNWWAVCLNRPRDGAVMRAWARARRSIPSSDGPYRDGGLESITLGRVVGILQPATEQVTYGRWSPVVFARPRLPAADRRRCDPHRQSHSSGRAGHGRAPGALRPVPGQKR